MSKVFVLDTNHQPLNPVHPGKARLLLKRGKAAIWHRFPFTIILKYAVAAPQVDPLRVKLDPGSKTTGITVLHDASGEVVFAAELSHRGHKVTSGRVLVRASGSFDIVTKTARVAGISFTSCCIVQRGEGYRYALGTAVPKSQIR